MALEYVIYTDESSSSGTYYSNFYGGALIRSIHLEPAERHLEGVKLAAGLRDEVKWSKVTDQYLDRYASLVNAFFDLIQEGKIKMRVMFTQNFHRASGLTAEHRSNQFTMLYYQFLKHAFGLPYSNDNEPQIGLRIILDQLPCTREQNALLRGYVAALHNSAAFRKAGLCLDMDRIVEAESHRHVIMQCLDIVLGGMQFKLNNRHLEKPVGARIRGKRTIAKEKLYKLMNKRIQEIYPNFNVGISTGMRGSQANLWHDPYRHWCFIPSNHTLDHGKTK